MPIDKWDPFREFLRFKNLFNEVFERAFQSSMIEQGLNAGGWSPVVDVYKEPDRIVVNAELPGIEEDKLEISYDKSILTIKGERLASCVNGEWAVHRLERQHGLFQRDINLPNIDVDQQGIKSSYQKGVLTVILPLA